MHKHTYTNIEMRKAECYFFNIVFESDINDLNKWITYLHFTCAQFRKNCAQVLKLYFVFFAEFSKNNFPFSLEHI